MMASAVSEPPVTAKPQPSRWLLPSLSDLIFAGLVLWLVAHSLAGSGFGILVDAFTGTLVRMGDFVLDQHRLPTTDQLTYTRYGAPWFNWEWLSTIAMSALHRFGGLQELMEVAAVVIALSVIVVIRHMVWRGANVLVAMLATHVMVTASAIHYLARPHIITILFLAIALWVLDADAAKPSRRMWMLVPLTIVWANMHAGFLAFLATLVILTAGRAAEALLFDRTQWQQVRRLGLLAFLCLLASAVNPFGFKLHQHALDFVSKSWVLDYVQEYQPIKLTTNEGHYFEILLIASVMVAAELIRRKQIANALMLLAWSHQALTSARHIPILAVVAMPFLAAQATEIWDLYVTRWSIGRTLTEIARDYEPDLMRNSVWAVVITLAVLAMGTRLALDGASDFPASTYPVDVVKRNAAVFAGTNTFSPDNWGDLLTYHYYPNSRVFVDGRCDLFDEKIYAEYSKVLEGAPGWQGVLDKYHVNVVFLPAKNPAIAALRSDPKWEKLDETKQAALFRRR